jgi:hypothetical protein
LKVAEAYETVILGEYKDIREDLHSSEEKVQDFLNYM